MTKAANEKAGVGLISTHTPLAGRDGDRLAALLHDHSFLLTRPLRDVTGIRKHHGRGLLFLLTRPLRDVTATKSI